MALIAIGYPAASVAVGLAQATEGAILIRRPQFTKANMAFFVIELFWAGLSIVEAFFAATHTPRWLPLMFVGLFVLAILITLPVAIPSAKYPDLTFPRWTYVLNITFGAVFAVAAYSVASAP